MVFCLHVLALQQTGDLSKAYPASRPVAAAMGSGLQPHYHPEEDAWITALVLKVTTPEPDTFMRI